MDPIPRENVVDHVFATPRSPDHPALVDGLTGFTLDYGELGDRIDLLAGALQERGVHRGDVVALFGLNGWQWAVALYASLRVGATVTPVNSLYTAGEVRVQLDHSGARLLFADTASAPRLPSDRPPSIGLDARLDPGGTSLDDLVALGRRPVPVPVDAAEDVALIPYSSGTTGVSKGVQLTHRNLVASLVQNDSVMTSLTAESRVLGLPPFFHIYGTQIALNLSLRAGATLVTLPRFDLETFLSVIAEQQTDRVYVSPPVLVLLDKCPLESHDLHALEFLLSGGAPLDSDLAGRVAARLGCVIRQGYGMTELGPTSHAVPDHRDDLPAGSVGLPVPFMDWKVVDPGTGRTLGAGEVGELWCRGPNVMKGYLRDPEATAATVDAEGFLHTGDMVVHDEHGVLVVVDRLKELVKYKGHQVAPAELEAVLLGHPGIADAAVAGRPDELAGEIPVAFVVRSPDASDLTAVEVAQFVAERVAPHKKVREVRFVESVPKSGSGKILRRLLPI